MRCIIMLNEKEKSVITLLKSTSTGKLIQSNLKLTMYMHTVIYNYDPSR